MYKDDQPSWIPLRLRGLTHYQVDAVDGYEDLYRHLTNQPCYQVPVLGEPRSLPTISPQSYPASLGVSTSSKPMSTLAIVYFK